MPDLFTHVCPREDWTAALRILFGQIEEPARSEQVAKVRSSASTGSIDLSALLVCYRDDEPIGVMLGIESAGRAFMGWIPVVASGQDAQMRLVVEDNLMTAAKEVARERKSRFVQILLGPDDREFAPLLLRHGFFHLTKLNYLRCPLADRSPPPLRADVIYEHYRPALHNEFLRALQQSYEQSMDCPELTGARDIEDVFESHQAQGEFRENHWLLAKLDGQTVGCLLLVGLSEYNALEIAYLAVLPHARGNGLGSELTRKALREGMAAGVDLITLAVDVRNHPAQRLYAAEGFEPWDERDAYLLLLDPADGKFDRRIMS